MGGDYGVELEIGQMLNVPDKCRKGGGALLYNNECLKVKIILGQIIWRIGCLRNIALCTKPK